MWQGWRRESQRSERLLWHWFPLVFFFCPNVNILIWWMILLSLIWHVMNWRKHQRKWKRIGQILTQIWLRSLNKHRNSLTGRRLQSVVHEHRQHSGAENPSTLLQEGCRGGHLSSQIILLVPKKRMAIDFIDRFCGVNSERPSFSSRWRHICVN